MSAKRVKRLVIGLAIGFALFAGGLWVLTKTLGNHETRYEGKPLTAWSEQLQSSDSGASNQAAIIISSKIVPRLIAQMLQDTNDSSLRLTLINQLNELPGITIYFYPAFERRAQAADGLGNFGVAARSAVPALIGVLQSQDAPVCPSAATALGQIQTDPDMVIPVLISCLNSPQTDLAANAATALGNFGSQSRAAVPILIKLLSAGEKQMRAAIPTALKKIDPEAAAKAGVR